MSIMKDHSTHQKTPSCPIWREIGRIEDLVCRKQNKWRFHRSVVRQHDGPDGTPAPIPFTTYDDLIIALQTRYDEMCARVDAQLAHGAPIEYVQPLPRLSIADVIGNAVDLPRGTETIYGQIAHATELVAEAIECRESEVIRHEKSLTDTFGILREGLRDIWLCYRWTIAWREERRDWASMLTAAEDDLYYSSLDGIAVELGDVASLEWLRDVATERNGHAKHLDFDAETALDNMRALTPKMNAAKRRVEEDLIEYMRILEVVHGFRLRRQSVITEYFKVARRDSDMSGDSSDEEMDEDEETDEEWSGQFDSDEEMSDE